MQFKIDKIIGDRVYRLNTMNERDQLELIKKYPHLKELVIGNDNEEPSNDIETEPKQVTSSRRGKRKPNSK